MDVSAKKYFVASREQLVPKARRRLRKRRSDEDDLDEDSRCDTIWKIVAVVLIALTFLLMGFIGYMVNVVFGAMASGHDKVSHGLMFPRESETREVRSLDGMWNFVRSNVTNPSEGIRDRWYDRDLAQNPKLKTIPMPVPSSYNDITEDASLRDHVGTVWYDRKFFAPKSWGENQRVWVRFGSVHYESFVWINGELVVKHEFGHLPFEAEITDVLKYGHENRITVLCDNVLIQTTIPQGKILEMANDNGTEIVQKYSFDFFNYAGIHRSVYLYTTPITHISEVVVTTDISGTDGKVFYQVISNTNTTADLDVVVKILDKNGQHVAESVASEDLKGIATIQNVKPWWPFLMHTDPGYLYTMEVYLSTRTQKNCDIYRQKIGIRTLKWSNSSFTINGKPIYFRGFGRHEDSDIRGKGLDLALLTKDFNLLKWVGANSYRTSHYPYSEESMQFADEHGIMIIDECPSVDTENYTPALLEKHKESIEQLIHRDRNHPSVVAWSIANEPRTSYIAADAYFGTVANYTKMLDPTRPITAAIAVGVNEDRAAKHLDFLSFNRYNAWYSNPGHLSMIRDNVIGEATAWHEKHNKLVLMSEYGSDTVEGLHIMPAYVWSEEFQVQQFSKHFEAFDILRHQGFFIGEFVWNFADFKTAQTYTRVGGNKKGIFTRNRQPKASAYHLRKRYYSLATQVDAYQTLPADLEYYVSDTYVQTETTAHNDL